MKFLFKLIFFILFLALLAAAGLFAFAYFKYDINGFKAIGEIVDLNKEVDESALVSNGYTEEDEISFRNLTDILSGTTIRINDRQIAAYVNKEYGGKINDQLPDGITGKLLEFTFSDINNATKELVQMKIIFKIDLSDFLETNLSSFPLSLVKKMVPTCLYVTELIELEHGDTYVLKSADLKIANVADDSQIYKALEIAEVSKSDISNMIANALVDAMFGDDGVLDRLKFKGMTDYRFEKNENNELVIFTILTSTTYTITYNGVKGSNEGNKTTYTITDLIIELHDALCDGYEFLGFYDSPEGGNLVTQIDATRMENVVLYARYYIIEYTITLDLNGGHFVGTSHELVIHYNVETRTFVLPFNIKKQVGEATLDFKGWTGTDVSEATYTITITRGTTGDKEYTARFVGETVNVTLMTNGGSFITAVSFDVGGKLDSDILDKFISESYRGYKATKWFIDPALTIEFDTEKSIVEDLVIYTELDYIVNTIYFLDYKEKFDTGLANHNLVIDSPVELNAYIYYVVFEEIVAEDDANFTVSYADSSLDLLRDAVQNYLDSYHMGINLLFQMKQVGSNLSVYIDEKYSDSEVLIADPEGTMLYQQVDYALTSNFVSSRTEESELPIDRIEKTYEVKSSDQLYYVVMNGFKPTFENNESDVAKLYQKVREVLISICDDSQDDIEKLHAIYEYLALNVNYDHYAATYISAFDSAKYDSWKLEGVFNSHKAVCEGYAKAFSLLANMENIPTVVVTGDSHAWNKSFVYGSWYVIDATHGDCAVSGHEMFSNTQFMITDALKESLRGTSNPSGYGFHTDDFVEFEANTEFNYYISCKPNGISLDLTNLADFNDLINYLKVNGKAGQTVEIYATEVKASAFLAAAKIAGVNFENSYVLLSNYSSEANVYEYTLK